tara:strand:+ start:444 stop:1034 length:591 start_codon:yes stop_codon:yes gene_type:complete
MPLYANIQNLIWPIFLIGSLLMLIAYVYQFYDFENIEHQKKGRIEINDNEIIIDYKQRIEYAELIDLKFEMDSYHGKRINRYYRHPVEKKSLGINNSIRLKTKVKSYDFNFKLEDKIHFKELQRTVFEVVKSEKLTKIDLKRQIELIPNEMKKFNEYKIFIIKQIVDKKLNCKEGLLLHGYKSDKEALELRNKYCK